MHRSVLRNVVRTAVAVGIAALVPMLVPQPASGFSSGPPNGFCGDPPLFNNCTQCHTSFPVDSGIGSVTVSGLPATYELGTTYALTVTVEDAEPARARWGFEMTVIDEVGGLQAGDFANLTGMTQISAGAGDARDYIKHTSSGTFQGQGASASWDIEWTAPATNVGAVHFYFAGNAANNSLTNSGDYIYTGDIAVPAPSAGADDLPVAQLVMRAFPNPAPGQGSIVFALPEAMSISLQILDASGRQVRSLAEGAWPQGEYRVEWDGRDDRGVLMPAGVYFTQLTSPQASAMERIVVIR